MKIRYKEQSMQAVPQEYREHVSEGVDWKEIVKWVGDLPPLPHVASKAIALIEDPGVTAGKLTSLLSQDTALAARVLKIANSAMFARQREIATINQAIMLIGFKALKGTIIAASLRQVSRKKSNYEHLVWENSTAVAIGCQLLCQKLRKSYAEEAFILGLLHDLGKLVLLRQIPERYEDIFETTATGKSFFEVEEAEIGCTHSLIGALVAKKWNFSEETCQVILHHHDPIEGITKEEYYEKTYLVQVADAIAHTLGYGHLEGYPSLEKFARAGAVALGVAEEEVDELFEVIQNRVDEQGAAFN